MSGELEPVDFAALDEEIFTCPARRRHNVIRIACVACASLTGIMVARFLSEPDQPYQPPAIEEINKHI